MKMFLLDHEEGCTPLVQCRSCRAAAFLREKLKSQDFQAFLALMQQKVERIIGLDELIEELGVSPRTRHALFHADIKTIRDVITKTNDELKRVPNFGNISLNELDGALLRFGRRRGEQIVES